MTVYTRDGTAVPAATFEAAYPGRLAAYRALSRWAAYIAESTYAAQRAAHGARSARTFTFRPVPIHRQLVDAMGRVLSGEMTPEAAMALLHTPDAMRARFHGEG